MISVCRVYPDEEVGPVLRYGGYVFLELEEVPTLGRYKTPVVLTSFGPVRTGFGQIY